MMAKKFGIGDKVIAKNTHIECGYRKGDIILITRKSLFGDLIGENLTNPQCYGEPWSYLGTNFRGKLIKSEEITHLVYFLGIPLFTVKDVRNDAN